MSNGPKQKDAERAADGEAWLNGYEAALADAISMVDAMGGPSFTNLSAPVLLRLKTRLVEMRGQARAA